jgi:hypothetical protein
MFPTGVLAALLLMTLAAPVPARARAGEAPLRVTTDSLAYCAELAQRLAAQPAPTEAARRLGEDGQRLCEAGQVRGGIAKLRRAIRSNQSGG